MNDAGGDAGAAPACYRPLPFQLRGRIGRVRFLAYALAPAVPFVLVGPWLIYGWPGGVAARLLFLLPLAILGSRRLRDIGLPWWLAALLFAPLAGASAWLYVALFALLAVIPGNKLPNRDGAPPCPHSDSLAALACLWVLPPLVAIAAVLTLAPKPQMPAGGVSSVPAQHTQLFILHDNLLIFLLSKR
ncbi:DUF805 domain-containing protein [Massilia sp. CCM 8734]|uniref:DUF805 domain-containing protein n=1 Tax=Massilia sp. CCM 8734 TaxID=2609283 RepID=UPI0014216F0A|nr:DUF805 domain-containing protein [Massilia sp. CCM 8734]